MATTAMDYESANGDRYDDEAPRYERDQRSASPRPARDDGMEDSRRRSASPGAHIDRPPREENGSRAGDEDGAVNPGSNLFVTGIHPRLSEAEVTRLFEKYGEVEKCQIMKDPHTKESRGFGFVKMVTSDQADAAKDGLQGEPIEGRTLSIEKARRARPRTPTPGKYFGPPKREGRGGGRFDDRRRGGGYGGHGRDDPYRYRGYERRNDDRYDRGYREERGYGGGGRGYERGGYDRDYDRSYRDDRSYGRDDRSYGRRDRGDDYAGAERSGYAGRDDRYESRRGGGAGYEQRDRYDRAERTRDPAPSAYAESGSRADPRDTYGSNRYSR